MMKIEETTMIEEEKRLRKLSHKAEKMKLEKRIEELESENRALRDRLETLEKQGM